MSSTSGLTRRVLSALAVGLGTICGSTSAADVTFTIDPSKSQQPISRFIYGVNPNGGGTVAPNAGLNQPDYAGLNLTLARLGGDRWTAYNWTNNASNAGTDYRLQSDNYLDGSTSPGDAVKATLTDAQNRGTAAIITIPIVGYLAADESGPVPPHVPPEQSEHFVPEYPSAADDPSPASHHVYQEEFALWIKRNFPVGLERNRAYSIYFMLDNEPDIWSEAHPEVHAAPTTYAELLQRSIAYSKALKRVAPEALVFGPASYGWNGYVSLQNAKDAVADNASINPANGRAYGDFLSYYLAQMNAAAQTAGYRLLDALDVHWYPEATALNSAGKPTRIIEQDASPDVAAARVNEPRSLWDPAYVEKSWITKDSTHGKAIALLPRLIGEIADSYPGTKLSMSEYNFGGGGDISGALAEADALGLFGKYNVFVAAEWPLAKDESFIHGAMRMFRNYDGHNGTFGDISVSAQTSDSAATSIYASTDSAHRGQLVLVAINRTAAPLTAEIKVEAKFATRNFTLFQLTSASPKSSDGSSVFPTPMGNLPVSELSHYHMPAQSVSTLVVTLR